MSSNSNREALLAFLKSQKCISFSTVNEEGLPWMANAYYSISDDFEIFFFSSPETKHGRNLVDNQNIAFSTFWYDENDLENRKGVQGVGTCKRVNNPLVIAKQLKHFYKVFPDWTEYFDLKSITDMLIEDRPYLIKPTLIKYWDDELYNEIGSEEFQF